MAEVTANYKCVRELTALSTNWVLRAKVTRKWNLSTYTRGAESGHVFNANLLDEECSEISASFFDDAALKYFPALAVNQAYEFELGEVKLEKEKFRRFESTLHLIFGNRAKVRQLPPKAFKYRSAGFIALNQFPSLVSSTERFIDVAALAVDIGPLVIASTYQKRTLRIVDASGFSVQLDLWGDLAHGCLFDLPHDKPPVIICRCVKLTNYAHITLSSEKDVTVVQVNPLDCEDAASIKAWRDSGYCPNMRFLPLTSIVQKPKPPSSSHVTLKQLNSFTTTSCCVLRARVRAIRHDESNSLWYNACPNARCSKQLIERESTFYCQRCCQEVEASVVKYKAQILLADAVAYAWVVGYDEAGESLFGLSAAKLKRMSESEVEKFTDVLTGTLHTEVNACVQVRVNDGFRKYILTHLAEKDCRRDASLMLADLV